LLGFVEHNDGRSDQARAHFEKAAATAERLQSDRIRARALSGLGSLAADNGDYKRARELKERSLDLVRASGDLWLVGLLTGALSRMYLGAGDVAMARRLILEAIDLARSLRSKGALPYGLEILGDICAREGNGPKAVRLYGAASTLREALSLDFSTTERITYSAALAQLRRLVSKDQFDREWSEGRLLSADAAMEFALDLPSKVSQ
jgi:tetratricopeptide (TPR) repeat protein